MTRFDNRITRENALDIIKRFAKEYRKELGKVPGEIIIVGGGSIMLNYKFREATQDFDVILRTVSGITDVINRFADANDLPRDWMNSDFVKMELYSPKLAEVSKHYCSLNNNTLEIRTVSGVYLIAMKLRAHREYRNDISDIAGILIEEREASKFIGYDEIRKAYHFLYDKDPAQELQVIVEELCNKSVLELKQLYEKCNKEEERIGSKVVSYLDNGAETDTRNVNDVIARIKEKMNTTTPYQLVAFDMDGTLLNSQKKISPETIAAIQEAMNQGVIVIMNTGRGIAELTEYLEILDIPYVNSVSGALVCDRKKDCVVYSRELEIDTVKALLEIAKQEDIMVHFLTQESIVQGDKIPRMEHYCMGVYQPMYEEIAKKWDNLYERYLENPFPAAKVNFYHTSPEARERTRQRILEKGLSVEMVNAEKTSLEISAVGIDKGVGIEKLCDYLHIPMSQVIVVGDADNDAGAMKRAGLAVAMGNANERIKQLADVMVADNDHDGCKEVLERYFSHGKRNEK